MGFYDRYNTSKAAEESGTWVQLGDGVAVKLRRGNSSASKAKRLELESRYKGVKKNGALSEKDNDEIFTRQLAEALVVDWAGIEYPAKIAAEMEFELVTEVANEDPSEPKMVLIGFSPSNALKVFETQHDFKWEVATALGERDTFKTYVAELDTKNS